MITPGHCWSKFSLKLTEAELRLSRFSISRVLNIHSKCFIRIVKIVFISVDGRKFHTNRQFFLLFSFFRILSVMVLHIVQKAWPALEFPWKELTLSLTPYLVCIPRSKSGCNPVVTFSPKVFSWDIRPPEAGSSAQLFLLEAWVAARADPVSVIFLLILHSLGDCILRKPFFGSLHLPALSF